MVELSSLAPSLFGIETCDYPAISVGLNTAAMLAYPPVTPIGFTAVWIFVFFNAFFFHLCILCTLLLRE